MAAAKMSDDLSAFVSEPIELFRADDLSWTDSAVTDGCFMYRTEDGQLLMIWSNFCEGGYCVGVARSKNGKVDGEWIQNDKLLFSKETFGTEDGGHGMIFKARDGRMYLSLHSPNKATETYREKTVFIPVREVDGSLICE